MTIAIITGSGGLIGAESVKFFSNKFDKIIGIDNCVTVIEKRNYTEKKHPSLKNFVIE